MMQGDEQKCPVRTCKSYGSNVPETLDFNYMTG